MPTIYPYIVHIMTTTQGDNMINVKELVYKALSGDERAYRNLVRRYGKVTTADLLKAGSKTCRQ